MRKLPASDPPSMNSKNIAFNTVLKLSVYPRYVLTKRLNSTTSKLCVKLFKEMGENISIQDIDTAHSVQQRNNAGTP